ncbi:MAG: hypothetical protein NVS4B3_25510 [Gemmatimonadaceae bacterium]
MSITPLYLVAVAAFIGCAPARGTSDKPRPSAVLRRANVLTDEEIVATNADVANAYDALARLRPNWLSGHGVTSFNSRVSEFAMIFVDGQPLGEINSLRTIPVYHVAEFRYYDFTEAGARFGLRAGSGGVIEVTTKVGDQHRSSPP